MSYSGKQTNRLWRRLMLGIGLSLWLAGGLQAQNANHETALWNDILNDRAQAVTQQLATGLDPNIKSEEGQPAVMWAIQNQSWSVYDLLRQHRNFDPNIANDNNETPLMYLAILGELERGQSLVQQGAKINRLGWTPLYYAASKGQLDFARWLLEEGAFIHAPAPDGTTPLMMAAFSGNRDVVDLFLQEGADLNAVNIHRHTAADWADSAKHSRLGNYLRSLAAGEESKAADSTQTEAEGQGADSDTASPREGGSGGSQYFDLGRFD